MEETVPSLTKINQQASVPLAAGQAEYSLPVLVQLALVAVVVGLLATAMIWFMLRSDSLFDYGLCALSAVLLARIGTALVWRR